MGKFIQVQLYREITLDLRLGKPPDDCAIGENVIGTVSCLGTDVGGGMATLRELQEVH